MIYLQLDVKYSEKPVEVDSNWVGLREHSDLPYLMWEFLVLLRYN